MKRARSGAPGSMPGPSKKKVVVPQSSQDDYEDTSNKSDDSDLQSETSNAPDTTSKQSKKGKGKSRVSTSIKGTKTPNRTAIRKFSQRAPPRLRQDVSDVNLHMDDIKTGGTRFVGSTPAPKTVQIGDLNNLQRFHVVMNRFKAMASEQSSDKPSNVPSDNPPANPAQQSAQSTDVAGAIANLKASSQGGPLPLDFILQQPVIDNRSYQWTVASRKQSRSDIEIWKLDVRYKLAGEKKITKLFVKETFKANYTKQEIETIATDLARFLERWPFPIAGTDVAQKRSVFNAVSLHHYPSKTFSIGKITPTEGKYRFTIDTISPETGALEETVMSLNPDGFTTLLKPVPALAPNVIVGRAYQQPPLQGVDTPAKQNCSDFIQNFQAGYFDKIISKSNVIQTFVDLQYEHLGHVVSGHAVRRAIDNRARHNLDNVKKSVEKFRKWYVFSPQRRDQKLFLQPSASMKKLQHIPFSAILVITLSRARIAVVTAAMDKARQDDPTDSINAWMVGCITADHVNEATKRGDPPPSQCTCENEEDTKVLSHTCLSCFASVLCSTMQLDERGDAVCENCVKGKHERAQGIVKADFDMKIRSLVWMEAGHWHSSKGKNDKEIKEEARSMIDLIVEKLCKEVVGAREIRDVYTGLKRTCFPQPKFGRRRDPFWVSFDALFPYGTFNNERRYHTPDNTVPTALWINYLKYNYLPATLSFIATFISSAQTDEDMKELLEQMDDIYRCLKISGFTKAKRLAVKHNAQDFSKQQDIWKSAVPPVFSAAAEAKLYKYTQLRPARDDTAEYIDKTRLLTIIEHIELKFQVEMPRSADGCPWPGPLFTMPPGWSWAVCWTVFTERQHREWIWCNKDFVQCDTTETIYLECVWQFCDPTYKEFLGLPMVLFPAHPLRMAVSKKVHKQQMRSGWKTVMPQSMDDRDDSLNNLLFETCVSNFAKLDFPEADYSIMLSEMSHIDIAKDYFDQELRTQLLSQKQSSHGTAYEIEDVAGDDDGNSGGADDIGGASIDLDRIAARDAEDIVPIDEGDVGEGIGEDVGSLDDTQVLTELDDEDMHAAMLSIEADVQRYATQLFNDSGQSGFRVSGSSDADHLRAIANDVVNGRLRGMTDPTATDNSGVLLLAVVQNRIAQKLGAWADGAVTAGSSEMLLTD